MSSSVSTPRLGTAFREQLKIIHFGVSQGDCTLIMIRAQDENDNWHTISTLIDTGKVGSAENIWTAIWNQITEEGGEELNYFVISHHDKDHLKWAAGILDIVQSSTYPWKDRLCIVDRIHTGKTRENYNQLPGNSGSTESNAYLTAVNKYQQDQRRGIFTDYDLFRIGAGGRYGPEYKLKNFQMLCVAANGYIDGTFKASILKPNNKPRLARLQENDFSLAFLLRFGSFRFYTGGDLHGTLDDTVKNVTGSMEGPLAQHLYSKVLGKAQPKARHVCAVLVHHHGSKSSTLGDFISYFNPRIAVCSTDGKSGQNRVFSAQVVDRLLSKDLPPEHLFANGRPQGSKKGPCTVLYTFRIQNTLSYYEVGKCSEDPATANKDPQYWKPCAPQDVILHVIAEEEGRSPLVNGEHPRIRTYRRQRDDWKQTQSDPYVTVSYETRLDDGSLVAYCDCDRYHENVRLPTREEP